MHESRRLIGTQFANPAYTLKLERLRLDHDNLKAVLDGLVAKMPDFGRKPSR